MPLETVIGHGRCPKCGGQTDIKYVEYFPFPEEQITQKVEECPRCKWSEERSKPLSTNDTTNFFYYWDREIKKGR